MNADNNRFVSMSRAELELTQKFQRNFPSGEMNGPMLHVWNTASAAAIEYNLKLLLRTVPRFLYPADSFHIEHLCTFIPSDKITKEWLDRFNVTLGGSFTKTFFDSTYTESTRDPFLSHSAILLSDLNILMVINEIGKENCSIPLSAVLDIFEWNFSGRDELLEDMPNVFFVKNFRTIEIVEIRNTEGAWGIYTIPDREKVYEKGTKFFFKNPLVR